MHTYFIIGLVVAMLPPAWVCPHRKAYPYISAKQEVTDVSMYAAQHSDPNWQWQRRTPLTNPWFGVVTSEAQLRRVLADRQGPGVPTIPDIDWKRHVLVVAALGEVPTGGWAARITLITEKPDHVLVRVNLRSPALTDFVPQVISYPTDIVCIPKTKLPASNKEWVFEDQNGYRLAAFKWSASNMGEHYI
jgi:hypothetical protein